VHALRRRLVAAIRRAGVAVAAVARHTAAARPLIADAAHGAEEAVVAGLTGGLELAGRRAAITVLAVAVIALLARIDVGASVEMGGNVSEKP
jgi:hypothetical protein